jgi:beta-lactamase class A
MRSFRPLLLFFCLGAFLSASTFAQNRSPQTQTQPRVSQDRVLQAKLQALTKDFRGTVGIYVRNLKTGQTATINADSLFPTASMIKVAILATLFDRMDKGELNYRDVWTYQDSLLYAGEDILGSFKAGERIEVSKVIMLMITTSDNTASLWCQLMAGTGLKINEWLSNNGFINLQVNSRTPGREAWRAKYGWGVTSPHDIAELLVSIREGRAVSPAASEEMYRALTRIYWNDEALSQIPPTVQVASKQGAVDRSRSEVLLVNAPHGDYVFSVITKNQEDASWTHENEGYVLLRKVSALLWHYFEPQSKWQPAKGEEKYW